MEFTFVENRYYTVRNFIQQNKLFVLCTMLVGIWYVDVWENSNSCSRVLPVATYFEQGNFILDKYKDKTIDISLVNGHYYMDKAPLPTMLTLPVFGILKALGLVHEVNGSYYGKAIYITGAFVCGIMPFLFILYYVAQLLVIKQREDLILMAFIAFIGSFIFIFAGTFFAHVLAAALLLAAFIQYQKSNYLLAGFLCGLGFLTEFTTIWIIASWMCIELFKHKSFKSALHLGLGLLPAVIFILCYNFYFTGNPFTMLYLFVADNFDLATKSTYGLGLPNPKAIYSLIFSENRGLLFYAPVLIYGLFVFLSEQKSNWKKKFSSIFFHPVFLPFILTLLFISSHAAWDGGWSYGPRHLTAVSVLMIFTLIQSDLFGKFKPVFWVLCGYGLCCTLLAKLTVIYSVPPLEENILSYLISKLKDAFNEGNLASLLLHQNALVGFVLFVLCFIVMVMNKPTAGVHLLRNSKA